MARNSKGTTRLQRMARAYTESATLYAALDLGLFTHVAAGHDTIDKLATVMDILPLNAEHLATAVQAMGLLEQRGAKLSFSDPFVKELEVEDEQIEAICAAMRAVRDA